MHEIGIATELYRLCQEELTARGGGVLQTVRIAVGELAAVEPELLVYAWQAVVADSSHAAAELQVDWHPARQLCVTCGEIAARQPGSWLRLCPTCELPLSVEGGDELDLLNFTLRQEVPLET